MICSGPTIEIASEPSVTRHDLRSFGPVILCPSTGPSSRAGWTPDRAEEYRVSPMLRTSGGLVAARVHLRPPSSSNVSCCQNCLDTSQVSAEFDGSIPSTTSPVTPNYATRLQVQILRWPDRCRTICRTGWMIIRKYVMPSGSSRQSDCTACWTGPASLQASLIHLALVQPQCPRFRLHEMYKRADTQIMLVVEASSSSSPTTACNKHFVVSGIRADALAA